MKDQELRERIGFWLNLGKQTEIQTPPKDPAAAAARAEMDIAWGKGRLAQLDGLGGAPGIDGTQDEQDLREALGLARTGDPKHLPKIEAILKQVLAALQKVPLTPSTDHIDWEPPLKPAEADDK